MSKKTFDLERMSPIACDVIAGERYHWCGCGDSATPPFCDKKDCAKACVVYEALLNETVYFCNCKQSKDPPFCDGSHAVLLRQALDRMKKS